MRRRIIPLGRPLPVVSSSLPAGSNEPSLTARAILRSRARRTRLHGLAPDGVCLAAPVTASAVGSYPAVSPLPGGLAPARRSLLCCTFLGVTATGRYPASCSSELGLSSRLDSPLARRRDRRSPVRRRRAQHGPAFRIPQASPYRPASARTRAPSRTERRRGHSGPHRRTRRARPPSPGEPLPRPVR